MRAKNIMDALNDVEHGMVEQALEKRKGRKQPWLRWVAAAACAVLVIGAGTFFLFGQQENKKPKGPSGGRWATDGRYLIPVYGEMAIEWPWEYKTPIERYPGVTLNGVTYGTRAREIGEALLGEALGTCTATGYDVYTETRYPAEFEVRAIRGVDPEQLVAVELEGTWVVFLREGLPIPATLGDWMDACSLPENLSLVRFRDAAGAWFLAESDETLWQVLAECRDAPGHIDDTAGPGEAFYISFTATSEALGVYKKVFTVTEDGRLFTNLMEYGYVFNIGEDAAGRIIRSATEHCTETEAEPYNTIVAGTLTELGDGYIRIDDSILCAEASDGIVYKVLTDDLRARRCLEYPDKLALGDIVVVEYSGTIDPSNGNTVTGAFSISEAIFAENGAQVPENGAEVPKDTVIAVTNSKE